MFDQFLVPVDLSPLSLHTVAVATRMASAAGIERIAVLHAVERLRDVDAARDCLTSALRWRQSWAAGVAVDVVIEGARTAAGAIDSALVEHPGTLCVMGAHGHGRSAAVFGSTTDTLLRTRFRPIVVVGPHAVCSTGRLDGTYLVPLDGSERADVVLPIVGAWSRAFKGSPRLLHVNADSCSVRTGDAPGLSMLADRAGMLDGVVGSGANCSIEIVDDRRASHGVVATARRQETSLAFLSTHGRGGISRLRSGSVAADIIRHLTCPAVVFRPLVTDR